MEAYKKGKLYIIDDLFPHPRSVHSWRGTEFHAYLDIFFEAQIQTSLSSVGLVGAMSQDAILAQYEKQYPQYVKRLSVLEEGENARLQDAEMVYFVFLNNAWKYLEAVERAGIPFVFELYPGGGLALYQEESDRKLEAVMKSSCFRGVIVTNNVVYDYLLEHNYCRKEQILLVPGCVLDNRVWQKSGGNKRYYGREKKTFDIAFASYRYSKYGEDKGYDTFLEVAKHLHDKSDKFRFHVIGNYDKTILDIGRLEGFISYYGVHASEWFNKFYQDMDVFLSPNKSSILRSRAFDGFPTGCAVDAAIRKVVLIAADELELNHGQYQNGKDIFIVENNVQVILDRILFLYRYPSMLKRMGESGYEKAKGLYSFERQMEPRIGLIDSVLRKSVRQGDSYE